MRLTFISDTHGLHERCNSDLPVGDVLIHAGDFMNSGIYSVEAVRFLDWFNSIEGYNTKVLIAGNHDRMFEDRPELAQELILSYPDIKYLQDDRLEVMIGKESIVIYGSPWQPEFCNWAFNLPRNGEELEKKWKKIPSDVDILITHGPPYGHLDIPGGKNIRVGCEILREVTDSIKPKIHVFGHIHGSAGIKSTDDTHYINASILNEEYQYSNPPISIQWSRDGNIIYEDD